MTFTDRLHQRIRATDSRVCLGIDPRPDLSPLTRPDRLGHDAARVAAAVEASFAAILRASHGSLACCKLQSAFFEAMGLPGLGAMAGLLRVARELELPAIVDAKRGDIGSTAEAYASAYLTDGDLTGDALTVNPYLGLDTLEPFLEAASVSGRGIFVVLKTSNPGSADLQDLPLAGGGVLYEALADRLKERAERLPRDGHGYTALGVVVGATYPEALAALRRRLPTSVLLVPGYGAQGAGAEDVAAAFDGDGLGAVVSASRSLTYMPAESERELAEAAAAAATTMRDAINRALDARS
ncbi:MAG: orotidine-5'-phosphate decarboxylase [Deinococcales bacterium]